MPDAAPTGSVPAPSAAAPAVFPINATHPATHEALARLDALPPVSAAALAKLFEHYGEVVAAHETGMSRLFGSPRPTLRTPRSGWPTSIAAAPPQPQSRSCWPPLFAIDLARTASLYEQDALLLVDLGGDDTYHNNAGGSRLADTGLPGTA